MHFIGAYMVFGFGMLYGWVELLIVYRISNALRVFKKWLILFKVVVLMVGTACFIGSKWRTEIRRVNE